MECQPNVAIVKRWFEEVWNQRRAETIFELTTRESICYADEGPLIGPEEFQQRQHTPFLAAFPDLKVTLEAVVGEGENVVARWIAEGTHSGDGLGFRPTNAPVLFRGMTWIRIVNGKLAEGWQSSNIPEVIRALAKGSA